MLPNGVEAAIAIYGILRAGAAFSPLNPTIKREKLGHVLADSGAAAVLCDARAGRDVGAAVASAGEIPVVTDVEALAAPAANRRRAPSASTSPRSSTPRDRPATRRG